MSSFQWQCHGLRGCAVAVIAVSALFASIQAWAGAIVVGRSGTAEGCSQPTIQAAINKANTLPGYNLIIVTDDVPDGVWHENLNFSNIRSDVQIELVGGYNNCTELMPTAFGKASLYGDTSLVRVSGAIDLRMRGFWMEGGAQHGISWDGSGTFELSNVTVNNNRWSGINFLGRNGEAHLKLTGSVEVTNNDGHGIIINNDTNPDSALLTVRGSGNSIRANSNGIYVLPAGRIDIGVTGDVVTANRGYGLYFDIWRGANARSSYVFSPSPIAPVRIRGNHQAGILLSATSPGHRLCIRNAVVEDNWNRAIYAKGAHAHLEMNGTGCQFPPEADVAFCVPQGGGSCNSISSNQAAANSPSIAAVDGARIDLNRVLLYNNKGSSLLSTNLGTATSRSSITLSDSVAIDNSLRDNLFESLNGGVVDVWNSTIHRNTGLFNTSLVGINPALLQLTNTILDQSQNLLDNQGPTAAIRFDHVLAPNETGTDGVVSRTILLGRPSYRDTLGRLNTGSLGVDHSPAGGSVDLDGNPRDVDTLGVVNLYGPRDLGAFEVQETQFDRIFAGSFERQPPR